MTSPPAKDIIRTRAIDVFSRVFSADPATIDDRTSPETLQEWDSLAHVQLVVELEKAFGVDIPPDEALELEHFKGVVDYLQRKLV